MALPVELLCLIVGISDGDTLTAKCPTETIKVRIAEIDAPEKKQAFGQRSKQSLSDLCFKSQAEVRPDKKDRYGRTVARVSCNGIDVSQHQTSTGMAWAYTKYLTDQSIKAYETQARAAKRGLWADPEPVPPWDWRKMK